ncbi:hypothetical protein L211DRAFT_871508 [Terfezia boudieri ATCC MYA-4762]|uniref:Uncharacterized protein n=1 Tax=Terfezia boudieri ATCC MYA-4762 TaxID=1051890 RepID=A0A3N4LC43_9PEZI|nr:hypothetical protein L211DRAFT_871508 [Terfezia boudieri ATCC MYA-4762]
MPPHYQWDSSREFSCQKGTAQAEERHLLPPACCDPRVDVSLKLPWIQRTEEPKRQNHEALEHLEIPGPVDLDVSVVYSNHSARISASTPSEHFIAERQLNLHLQIYLLLLAHMSGASQLLSPVWGWLHKRQGSVSEEGNTDNTAFVLSYSTVEIDYISGYTIQALTWQPGGITFLRLTPTTAPLPPLVVLYSCSAMDAPFFVTIHLSNSTKKELLHIDSEIKYKTLLQRIGAHYEYNIVAEDGSSTVGLGLSTKAWNSPDTREWAQKLEALEDLNAQGEDYMEMILSADTEIKWEWYLELRDKRLCSLVI